MNAIRHIQAALNILGDVPPPPATLYHATPYASEILSGGFEIKPERQTFGGHGDYVSLTTLDNVRDYATDLKIIVGFLNDEISWEELERILSARGLATALNASVHNAIFNELSNLRIKLSEEKQAKGMKFEKAYKITDKEMKPLYDKYHRNNTDKQKEAFYMGKDCYGNPVTAEQELKRRWVVLTGLWSYSTGSEGTFALIMSGDVPQHLLNKSMNDVGVVEVAIAPATPASEMGYESPERMEDTKGKYTYNPNEKEWRFYDTTDLWPVKLVACAFLNNAIKLLGQQIQYEIFTPDPYNPPVPIPKGYVYHVSPYAQEILSEGFKVDPTKTTLGAIGPSMSVSTTTYQNAVLYKKGIQLVVGVTNGEIDWDEFFAIARELGATEGGISGAIQYVMKEDFMIFYEKTDYGFGKFFNVLKEKKKLIKRIVLMILSESAIYLKNNYSQDFPKSILILLNY